MKPAVLIINSRPHRWLYGGTRCLVPLSDVKPYLVTHNYGGVVGLDAADFPDTAICDLRDERHVQRLCEWLINEHNIQRIVAPNERFILLAAQLRTKFGLPGLNAKTAVLFRDKIAMKTTVSKSGIRVPAFVPADDLRSLRNVSWSRPKVLKSRFGVGSKEVQVISSHAEAEEAWRAINPAPGTYQLEDYIDGPMYHCDSVVWKSRVVFSSVSRYLARPGDFDGGVFGGSMILPAGPLRDRILNLNVTAIGALGLRNGVAHLEVFHTPDDELVFCEVAARPGGGIERMIERCYGINTVENAIRLECGMDPIVEPDRAAEGQVWGCIGIYPNGERVRIDRRSLANLGITDHFESPAYGDRNGNPRHCTDYTDLYVLTAPDEASFNANVEALRELYEVRAQ